MKLINKKKVAFFGKEFDTQRECAEYFGVSNAFMSTVFRGIKPPSNEMLERCGYRKIVKKTITYEKINDLD